MKLHPFEPGTPWWRSLLLLLVRVWGIVLLLLWVGQELVIFPGLWLRQPDVRAAHWGELIEAPRPDGSMVPVLLEGRHHGRVVLLFHGNGESAVQMEPYARFLDERGWACAAMEYRGYAGVAGWPTETSLSEDVEAVIRALEQLGLPPDRTVVHGRSIGGGVAGSYLDHAKPAGVVLESTFDSLENVVRDRWIGLIAPVSLLLRSPFPTATRLARARVPVLQVHDTSDVVVGIARARALRQQVAAEGVETEGHAHGVPLVLGVPAAKQAWTRWLETTLSPAPP